MLIGIVLLIFLIFVLIICLIEYILVKSIIKDYSLALGLIQEILLFKECGCPTLEKCQKRQNLINKIKLKMKLLKFIEKIKIIHFKKSSTNHLLNQLNHRKKLYDKEANKMVRKLICIAS
jgi:hypothetical protein